MNEMTMMLLVLLTAVVITGCASGVSFPSAPLSHADTPLGHQCSYDMNRDGVPDYFTYADESGRITMIAYDYSNSGTPTSQVKLDSLPASRCRHFMLILDGVSYDLLKEFYDKGHLRMFHPPSRVIAPFPAMTDVAIEDEIGFIPARSMEAAYYDRRKNAQNLGSWDYLTKKNEPYADILTYRVSTLFDGISYLAPWQVFKHEVGKSKSVFDRRDRLDTLAYYVGSAGMGTANGREGHVRCLEMMERLVNQIMWETRGNAKFTLTADHGHTYTQAKRLDTTAILKKKGWKSVSHLKGKKDFVQVKFGVVTYAAFYSHDAPGLARDLAGIEGVQFAVYHRDGKVFLDSAHGDAVISEKNGRFKYEAQGGDPLQLNEIIARLKAAGKVDAEGFIEDKALFDATVTHVYPDPLRRLWRSFYTLVENPPDVMISLEDNWYAGSGTFTFLAKVASTHGGLNAANSTTFIMSTVAPLPPALRSDEVPAAISKILGRPFPPHREGK